ALHESGMKLLLHSCGCVDGIADDFIGAGIDVFQFDQPMLYDFESLSRRIKGKATLWSPVDIQKDLPTGDKELIQAEARRMIKAFHQGGGFIAKDYPSLNDIGVKDEWAGWAREIFLGMHNE
ncbi:MAG: uroporphyrinogen decarboxylase family protein, partial [Defluviitaleaceae bacterium]|nr:uroporphyrinogen decarboxylase family protein [Defluviitaleaceae bacterium]